MTIGLSCDQSKQPTHYSDEKMAGAILISEGNGVSLSSVDFDYIVEKIRSCFRQDERVFQDEIYGAVDEGGMAFISLKEQNEDGFKIFYRAVLAAYDQEFSDSGGSQCKVMWDELIQALQADLRYYVVD